MMLTVITSGVASCLTATDCAMNGECDRVGDDPQQPGTCTCYAGWVGQRCERLDLLPSQHGGGLRMPNNESTWGGSIIEWNGTYHMYASHIVNGCGLGAWTTNSEVVHAVAIAPEGPYTVKDVVLPPWAHDTNAMLAASGEIVIFFTGKAGVRPRDCGGSSVQAADRSVDIPAPPPPPPPPPIPRAPPKDSWMIYARNPDGPWSSPVMVLNSSRFNSDYFNRTGRIAVCDTNLNGIIRGDGSFVGLWRRCETDELHTVPHTLFAADWRNASTYVPNLSPLFVLGGSGAEDPSNIWITTARDGTLAYHALFHDEQATRCMLPTGCSANGRHAFSLDGKAWRYATEDAWTRNVTLTDGTSLQANTRARPHVLLDGDGRLTHLSTGLQARAAAESDYVWTLVTPLRGNSSSTRVASYRHTVR